MMMKSLGTSLQTFYSTEKEERAGYGAKSSPLLLLHTNTPPKTLLLDFHVPVQAPRRVQLTTSNVQSITPGARKDKSIYKPLRQIDSLSCSSTTGRLPLYKVES